MSIEENVQIVRDFFAAMGGYNRHDLLALVAEDIAWIIEQSPAQLHASRLIGPRGKHAFLRAHRSLSPKGTYSALGCPESCTRVTLTGRPPFLVSSATPPPEL